MNVHELKTEREKWEAVTTLVGPGEIRDLASYVLGLILEIERLRQVVARVAVDGEPLSDRDRQMLS